MKNNLRHFSFPQDDSSDPSYLEGIFRSVYDDTNRFLKEKDLLQFF
jgi:hypothetical protein